MLQMIYLTIRPHKYTDIPIATERYPSALRESCNVAKERSYLLSYKIFNLATNGLCVECILSN